MPLVQFFVHVVVGLENADEIHGGGHGAIVPESVPGRPSATAEPRQAHNRWMEDLRPKTEDTPSGRTLLKRSPGSEESTRHPLRIYEFTFSFSKNIFWFGLGENTLSVNYSFATDFVLLIKYSF